MRLQIYQIRPAKQIVLETAFVQARIFLSLSSLLSGGSKHGGLKTLFLPIQVEKHSVSSSGGGGGG